MISLFLDTSDKRIIVSILKDLEIINSKASVRMDNLLNTLNEEYSITEKYKIIDEINNDNK